MIQRGYRYKLGPTPEQEDLLAQFAGVCRLIYNIALEQRRDHWQRFRSRTGQNISYPSQARELTLLRDEFDWIAAVSQTCQQQTLRDLDRAYQNWFKGIAKYPTPRKKGRNDTFRYQGREVQTRKLNGKWSEVRLPKIGWVGYRDTRALRGKINNATISLDAKGWHISFAVAIEHEAPANIAPSVGVDRGVANTLALSTGERLCVPERLIKLEKRQRRAQKMLSRRKRGSRRYAKARKRVATLSALRSRIRKDWHHRASLDLSRRFGTVVLEDLKTRNMTASAKGSADEPGRMVRQKAGLNRSILNQGWHIFETLLEYKLEERGGYLCKVPAHYTSQTCAECGTVDRESRQSQASFSCKHCGHTDHADTNAAKVILRRNTASMDMEEGHWLSCEVSTRKSRKALENPPPSGGGRC
ncbi:ISAfe8, transposase [Roseibium sp. TrichSKD4]|uniref:RNA-guided endonuclease InsQ/TnpB family protein n=1 Tax=Roseibium sp. TrichSKD4 TaxID=744980 RepID=UPI0001E56385|nr:RNA-guided endonuclease TnpB family protein [Roseibium sp. TrichSKD4]EFO33903.1 ISAfe8, transposase [Roseibium sp. TrichSKD4]